jgi:hypothetical protein
MAGRLGHIDGNRRAGHIPVNGIRKTNYAYGFANAVDWLDADFGLPTRTNGALISSWTDRINGKVWTQGTASAQPLLVSADSDFNGYPSLDFSTSAKQLINNTIETNLRTLTLFMVIKNTVISTGVNYVIGRNILTGSVGMAVVSGGTNVNGIGFVNGMGLTGPPNILTSSVNDTLPHICVLTYRDIIIDGVIQISGNAAPYSTGIGWSDINTLTHNNAGRASVMKIAEIGVFLETFTQAQALQLSDRLNSKYAIY